MRFLGVETDCGPLLELGQIQRQLRLGAPVYEGLETIAVNKVIGTLSRVHDFDGCFHPLHPALRKRIDDIQAASPAATDQPIDVVRIDRAYFVSDGHKRVAIARETGQEFIDAHVSRLPSPYELTPEVDADAIERTAREGEFRRHSGLGAAVPQARFVLTDLGGYGELLLAVHGYSYDRMLSAGQLLEPVDTARTWYVEEYLTLVALGREALSGLLDSLTDADLFLALHRQWREWWGTDCADNECLADMLRAAEARDAAARSPIDRVLRRGTRSRRAPAILPLADDSPRRAEARAEHEN